MTKKSINYFVLDTEHVVLCWTEVENTYQTSSCFNKQMLQLHKLDVVYLQNLKHNAVDHQRRSLFVLPFLVRAAQICLCKQNARRAGHSVLKSGFYNKYKIHNY